MNVKSVLSALTACICGLMGYLVLRCLNVDHALFFAVLFALLFYLIMVPALILYKKAMLRKYASFEKQITSPIFYRTNGNFHLINGNIKNGNIYFCEAGIVCVCLEEKPHALDTILVQDIDRCVFSMTSLTIDTIDGRRFVISVPETERLKAILIEKGWICSV